VKKRNIIQGTTTPVILFFIQFFDRIIFFLLMDECFVFLLPLPSSFLKKSVGEVRALRCKKDNSTEPQHANISWDSAGGSLPYSMSTNTARQVAAVPFAESKKSQWKSLIKKVFYLEVQN